MRERRLVKVAMTSEFLFNLLTQDFEIEGSVRVKHGLPKDSVFIMSYFEDKTMTAYLVFEHETFAPVLVGSEIPFFDITLEKRIPEWITQNV